MRAVWLVETRLRKGGPWKATVAVFRKAKEARRSASDWDSTLWDYRAVKYVPAPAKKKGRK